MSAVSQLQTTRTRQSSSRKAASTRASRVWFSTNWAPSTPRESWAWLRGDIRDGDARSIHERRSRAVARQDDVGSTGQIAALEAKTVAEEVERFSNTQFRRRVSLPHPTHPFAALFGRESSTASLPVGAEAARRAGHPTATTEKSTRPHIASRTAWDLLLSGKSHRRASLMPSFHVKVVEAAGSPYRRPCVGDTALPSEGPSW